MALTSRALIAGLAVLPAFAATTTAAASVDPIFAAIERHRAAMRALEDIDELAEPDAYAKAEQEIAAAYDAMLATVPQTTPGCAARPHDRRRWRGRRGSPERAARGARWGRRTSGLARLLN